MLLIFWNLSKIIWKVITLLRFVLLSENREQCALLCGWFTEYHRDFHLAVLSTMSSFLAGVRLCVHFPFFKPRFWLVLSLCKSYAWLIWTWWNKIPHREMEGYVFLFTQIIFRLLLSNMYLIIEKSSQLNIWNSIFEI